MSRTPYPTTLPMESVTNLIRIVRNGTIQSEIKEFAADIWNVQGYLQSIIPGTPDAVINGQPPDDAGKAALVELAELLDDIEIPLVIGAQPVGSDFSLFLHEIKTLGLAKALSNFILRIFNIPVT